MNKVLRYSSIALATVGLGMGIASADSASIDTTGPHSTNKITLDNDNSATVTNKNDAKVTNDNNQSGTSGRAEVEDNTTGGDATSGDVNNDNSSDTNVSVSNGSGSNWSDFFGNNGGTGTAISNTGPHSNNTIRVENDNNLRVNNTNNVTVSNNNTQRGTSGSASVEDNTTGGSATSGSVSNTNSSSTSVDISN